MSKVCVVAGGSQGIGQSIVREFKENGYKVYVLDVIESKEALYIHCDVSKYTNIMSAFQAISRSEDKIDALVVSSGIHFSGDVESTPNEVFYNIIDVNIIGVFYVLKEALPLMKKNGGSIVLLSSDQAIVGKPNSYAYGLTKAAVSSMARSIAIDYAQYGIRCNAVCPGTIDTPLYRKAIENASVKYGCSVDDVHASECKMHLFNRIGTSDEVASLVYYLSSPKADFITGTNQVIDGGYTAV